MTKKSLLITLIVALSTLLVWCNKDIDNEDIVPDNQQQVIKDFWLDFSDYIYEWFNDSWGMDIYSTWDYLSWGRNWKRTFYYSNGQIASEQYFKDGHINGGWTWYYPTYWIYVYYMTWDKIYEHYIEKPEWIWIEEEPTWWLMYTDICEDWTRNCLWTDYLSAKNVETEKSVVESTTYFEDWNLIWIEIKWNRYSADEYKTMSDEEKDALFTSDEDELMYWYYHLSTEKLPLR